MIETLNFHPDARPGEGATLDNYETRAAMLTQGTCRCGAPSSALKKGVDLTGKMCTLFVSGACTGIKAEQSDQEIIFVARIEHNDNADLEAKIAQALCNPNKS